MADTRNPFVVLAGEPFLQEIERLVSIALEPETQAMALTVSFSGGVKGKNFTPPGG
jgi:hypothetical protein